jgi:hypothetical protein
MGGRGTVCLGVPVQCFAGSLYTSRIGTEEHYHCYRLVELCRCFFLVSDRMAESGSISIERARVRCIVNVADTSRTRCSDLLFLMVG